MKYKIRIEDRLFEVEITDLHARPIIAIVEGERFEIWPENGAKHPPASMSGVKSQADHRQAQPPQPEPESKSRVISAPIPGVIVEIAVKPGDTVSAGQELCVLEAMKMKNPIRAPRAGKIAAVHVTVGQQVKHRAALFDYADYAEQAE